MIILSLEPQDLGPVVRKVDDSIQSMNSYQMDTVGVFLIYPLDKIVHSLYNRELMVLLEGNLDGGTLTIGSWTPLPQRERRPLRRFLAPAWTLGGDYSIS